MANIPKFIDEQGINLNRYLVTEEDGTSYYITLNRGATITQVGTPLNAENLNRIVDRLNNLKLYVHNIFLQFASYDEAGEIVFKIINNDSTPYTNANLSNLISTNIIPQNTRMEVGGMLFLAQGNIEAYPLYMDTDDVGIYIYYRYQGKTDSIHETGGNIKDDVQEIKI